MCRKHFLRPVRPWRASGSVQQISCDKRLTSSVGGFWCLAAVFILLAPLAPACFAGGVNVSPWGDPNVTQFPPGSPPNNPPIGDGGDADARPFVGWSTTGFRGNWNPDTNEYEVTDLNDVTIGGRTDIREPCDVDPNLHEHELGHDRLNRYEYEKRAKKKVEEALEGFEGMKFKGDCNTPAERMKNAIKKAEEELKKRMARAIQAISQQMDELSAKYDTLTDHGRKDDPNTAEGEEKAKKERNKAPEAGSAPAEPNDTEESTGSTSSKAEFDDDEQRLILGGPMVINYTGNPTDLILGRGKLWVDPMTLIGVKENGTISLSDTSLGIADSWEEEVVLMKGFVFEAAYMPSTWAGAAGMIQGYLDIPPDWAGGINNTIDSEFLEGLRAARDANSLTTFWFYAHEELFDENAQSLIPELGVDGSVALGVGIPTEFVVVEDFEQYESDPCLQAAWTPYGSAVMTLSTEAAHGGGKAMLLAYDNTAGPNFAEVTRTYDSPQDWTAKEPKALELWINDAGGGDSINELYVALADTEGDYYKFAPSHNNNWRGLDVNQPWWSLNISLQDFEAGDVTMTMIEQLSIGFGNGEDAGGAGAVYLDDIRLHPRRGIEQPQFDLDGDYVANFKDFAYFAAAWLEEGLWP